MSTPANASAALATVVVDELIRAGMTDLVLSPGSRSAALAFAAWEAASEGRLRIHTRIDERSAAFVALGLARTQRRHVAVVTTSGTAVANLHPAVLEADHAGLALVLLTADRPAHLRGTGANQTTNQVGIFGTAVRLAADVPPGGPEHVEDWRALASKAAWTARGRLGLPRGPVHLNLQFAEPLVPGITDGWSAALEGRPDGSPWSDADPRSESEPETLDAGPLTVVVAGDDAGPPARVLAQDNGWPLLAEPTSGSRTGENAIRTYRLLLGLESLSSRIERVVIAGHPTLSRPVIRLISRQDVEVVAMSSNGSWTDPGHRVSRVFDTAPAVVGADPTNGDWLAEWKRLDDAVAKRLDAWVDDHGFHPLQVARTVSAAVPPGGLLFVGSSNPIRDLDLNVAKYNVGDRRMVIANRGLAGIDGTVSSAIGAALGRPHSTRAMALMGDVTFLHDANGLVLGPDEPRPDLQIIVVNDDGGSIFHALEQGAEEYADSFERLFATPHGTNIEALCAAHRVPHLTVSSDGELRAALGSPNGGIEIVEAKVSRVDRRADVEALRGLLADLAT